MNTYTTKLLVLFLNLLILFTYSCTNNSTSKLNNNAKIFLNVSDWLKDHTIPGEIIKEIEYVPLETRQECLLGEIKKIIAANDLFYIQDRGINKKVFIFDRDGKFIKAIGTYGKGPGELIDLSDFTLDSINERLFILDSHSCKIIVCDQYTGKLIKEIKFNFHSKHLTLIDHNTIAFYSHFNHFNSKQKYSIACLDFESEKVNWLLPQDEYDTRLSYHQTFFKSKSTFYTSYFKDVIYKFESNNAIPFIKLNFGVSKIPSDKLIRTGNKGDEIINLIQENDWSYGIKNVFETDKLIVFDFKLKQQDIQVFYSKETGNYFYGNKFDNPIEGTHTFKHYEEMHNKLITVIDPLRFKMIEKNILNNKDDSFKKHYQQKKNIITNQNRHPNPIIRIVKYEI